MCRTIFILLFLSLVYTCFAQGWSTPVLVSDMPGINNNQDMCIDRTGTRHVVWSHTVTSGYWSIMYSKSTTGGMTWTTPDTIVNIPGAWLYEPHIVSDTFNNIYVSFDSISQGGSFGQVYLITKQGELWGTPHRISNENEMAMHSLMTIDGNNKLYVFWQGYFNQNYKFIYKYLENEVWSEQIIPFVDSNYYSIRSIKSDKHNNIHCTGLFKFFGEGGSRRRVFYTMYENSTNAWQSFEVLNNYNSDQGCDVAEDTTSSPNLVWGQYTNTALPYSFATVFKGHNQWGWEESDTITIVEEYNQKLIIDKNNTMHVIDCYVLPDNNTLTTFNYYSFTADGWSKEILDENGSIIMFDMETTDQTVDVVYGKMIDRPGPDTVRIYFISKSILVDLPQPINREQPLSIYPNPCERWATISVTPTNLIPMSMKVFNMEGKPVKTFFENLTPTYKNEISWDLKDDNSRLIPSGVYLLVLKSKKFIYVKRFVKI